MNNSFNEGLWCKDMTKMNCITDDECHNLNADLCCSWHEKGIGFGFCHKYQRDIKGYSYARLPECKRDIETINVNVEENNASNME